MNMYDYVYEIVRKIPKGNISSYGEVAKAANLFRGARMVGWALKALPAGSDVPWQRVVNAKAQISIVNPHLTASRQGELLQEEGLTIKEENGMLIVENPPWYYFNTDL